MSRDAYLKLQVRRRAFERLTSNLRVTPGQPFSAVCPCCGYPALTDRGAYDICVICGWEDDGQDDESGSDEIWGGPNYDYSLTEARANFVKYGHQYRPIDMIRFDRESRDQDNRTAMVATFESILPKPSVDDYLAILPRISALSAECSHILSDWIRDYYPDNTKRGEPLIVAETPRLILRRWVMGDIPAVAHIYSDDETMRFYGGAGAFTLDSLAASFEDVISEYGFGYGNYAVIERVSGSIIGHCGVRWAEKRERPEIDVCLKRSVWRRGYALEVMNAVIAMAFEANRVTEIFAITHRDNVASIALMRRLGMTLVEDIDAGGVPSVVYRLDRPVDDGSSADRC